ncbi:MAG: extradiol ring-cleavage dioxygenase, partial [Xanthobacteraceae bacterium]
PMLTLEGKRWSERAADDMRNPSLNMSDGRFVSYEQLARENGAPYGSVATEERFLQVERASQRALDRLAGEIEASAPDVVVIVGDDQQELFSAANMPAVSIYYGERVVMHPFEINERSPSWLGAVTKGYAMDAAHEFAGHPELALDLIRGLIERDVDVGVSARIDDPGKAGFGHAYGFIVERLFKGRAIPVVPVLLNTYYPPNQITARRCYDIGRALRASIEASVLNLRVAVAASGGLSHFVVDDVLDQGVLDALRAKDAQALREIPQAALNSGSSEIRNWIMVAALVEGLKLAWSEYHPVRRTPAGTGTGVAFASWS